MKSLSVGTRKVPGCGQMFLFIFVAQLLPSVFSLQRVIIIKHGDLSLQDEMFDLSNYMKMNTYLDSQDPWFWPKLR